MEKSNKIISIFLLILSSLLFSCSEPKSDYGIAMEFFNATRSEQSDAKAFEYMKKSANAGNLDALYMLGIFYVSGRGVDKNDTEAFRLYKELADLGDRNAKIMLSNLYASGTGTAPDPEKAQAILTELGMLK